MVAWQMTWFKHGGRRGNEMATDMEDDVDLMSLLTSYRNQHWDVYCNRHKALVLAIVWMRDLN